MTKEPTRTIYHGLAENFWTQQKCQRCQTFFTKFDYAQQNYQLTFQTVLSTEQNQLSVLVQLSHQQCCSSCLSYLQDIYQTQSKSHVQTS